MVEVRHFSWSFVFSIYLKGRQIDRARWFVNSLNAAIIRKPETRNPMQVLHVGGRDISGFSPERFIYLFEWQKDREAFCNIWLTPQMSSWPEIGPCWSRELRAASGASTWVAISQNVGHLLLLSWSLVGTWIKIRALGTWMWDGGIHVVMWPAEHNASVTHKYLSRDLLLCRLCNNREMDGKQNRTWLDLSDTGCEHPKQ